MIPTPNETPEKELLEHLAFASLTEQRRSRRWGIFFKSAFLLYLIAILWLMLPPDTFESRTKPHTALIDIHGVIEAGGAADADSIATSLNEAFKDSNTQGIILRIDSPGGSPVQAAYVYDEIRRLQKKYPKIKVYAVCSDLCTSAAYYIASAANQIYANPSSLVGSIGALMEGFGLVDAIHKVGVERRLFVSGAHKGMLDPFSPLTDQDKAFAQKMLDIVHQQFINKVKEGRGSRLKDDPELFSGLAWTGEQALPLGLIDGFGSAGYVAREIIKNDDIVDYTIKPSYMEILASKVGATFAKSIKSELIATQMK